MLRNILNLPIFSFKNGRQAASLILSRVFEKNFIKSIFGANLVAIMLFTAIITPNGINLFNQLSVEASVNETLISAEADTITTIESPLTDYRISQMFSFFHPGLDMVCDLGTPIYAIDEGIVEYSGNMFFGYGKYIIISHPHDIKSLYAHLSEIDIVVGRKVQRGELIGKVGSTGWSTGNHLHLEIHQHNIAINPLDVLPIKTEDIKYDGIVYSQPASPSAVLN